MLIDRRCRRRGHAAAIGTERHPGLVLRCHGSCRYGRVGRLARGVWYHAINTGAGPLSHSVGGMRGLHATLDRMFKQVVTLHDTLAQVPERRSADREREAARRAPRNATQRPRAVIRGVGRLPQLSNARRSRRVPFKIAGIPPWRAGARFACTAGPRRSGPGPQATSCAPAARSRPGRLALFDRRKRSLRVGQPEAHCLHDCRPAAARVELAQDGRHMVVDSPARNDQTRGDLGVAQPAQRRPPTRPASTSRSISSARGVASSAGKSGRRPDGRARPPAGSPRIPRVRCRIHHGLPICERSVELRGKPA